MVNYSQSVLDSTFSALSDPTRRAILMQLASGDTTVTELAKPFEMSLPAISKHLRVLEGAGLLVQEKKGRIRRCRLEAKPLQVADKWIMDYRKFWEESYDRLDEFLHTLKKERK